MSNNKKSSSIAKPTKTRSFTELLFVVYAFLFFSVGLLLLFFTKEVSIFTIEGEYEEIMYIIQQFLATSYLLLGVTFFSLRKLKGRRMIRTIILIILVSFINLYLIFSMNDQTIVPSEQFIAQILMQISLVVALIEQVKRK